MVSLESELEDRLIQWSYWIISFYRNEVGYSPTSTIVNFGLGDGFIRESKPPFPINNLQADEMNGWINMLGKYYPAHAQAIHAWYLRERGLKQYEVAKLLNLPLKTFQTRLLLGRRWLEGRLSIDK